MGFLSEAEPSSRGTNPTLAEAVTANQFAIFTCAMELYFTYIWNQAVYY